MTSLTHPNPTIPLPPSPLHLPSSLSRPSPSLRCSTTTTTHSQGGKGTGSETPGLSIKNMGLALSCPGDDAFDQGFETLLTRSFRYDSGNGNVKSTRSVSFNGRASEPAAAILKAFGSGKLVIEGSLSFKREDTSKSGADPNYQLETKISIKSPKGNPMKATYRTSRFSLSNERVPPSPVPDCPKHRAAVKLQKVYKSFRTRRQLADCAVLIEQRWWKLLDFALLKQSSVSFYDIEEPESVVSRWLRARRRAATVGKGLSKDEKAQKLALQHWLEAIDPRHRYGHNLHFYYDCWLRCESNQPFFYWLDVGDGREVNLDGQCPRSKLQQQCIKYLGPKEREVYEVIVDNAKFLYKRTGKLLDTSEGPKDSKWIFVLSTSKTLYVGQKKKGNFQHSSFLAGGATSAAGRLVVESGILKAVWPHSGHYRPTEENFQEFMTFLKENNVDLTDVTLSPTEDDEEMLGKSVRSEQDGTQTSTSAGTEAGPKRTSSLESFKGGNNYCTEFKLDGDRADKRPLNLPQYQKVYKKTPKDMEEGDDEATKITSRFLKSKLAIQPKRVVEHKCSHSADFQLLEDSPISEGHYKPNLFSEEEEENEDASVPEELILRRIKSKKAMESYQLGKQLSCKWTTGAGPRIGWVRDYPSELQFRSLEQVHLSPRTDRPYPSPRIPLSPSPRIPDLAFARKVPLLQKPNMRRRN